MVFESSPSTIPELILTKQSDSHLDPRPEFENTRSTRAERSSLTLTRDDPAHQHEGDANSPTPFHSRSPQSSTLTVHDVAGPSSFFGISAPSSTVDHSLRNVPYYIGNDGGRPSSPPSSTIESKSRPTSKKQKQRRSFPAPITNDKLLIPTPIPNTTAPDSYSKNHFVPSFIHKLKPLNPTLILQNSGSVARDHLASERTFLAYVRTSLGLAVAGVSIVQLATIAELTSKTTGMSSEVDRRVRVLAMPLGVVSMVFALTILFFGVYRYYAIQRALLKNLFPSATWCIMFITFLLGAFLVITFGALLLEKLGS